MKRGIIPASLHGMTEVEVYPQVSAKAQMETTKMQYESRKKPLEAFKKTNKRKNRI